MTLAGLSVLVPTCGRPDLLQVALESVRAQRSSHIVEVLVGDDSPGDLRHATEKVVAGFRDLPMRLLSNDPPLGNYPNQAMLGRKAAARYCMLLHDDDTLLPGAVERLMCAVDTENDPSVGVWFGRSRLMHRDGRVDAEASQASHRAYGKAGPSRVDDMWRWTLTHSLPPDGFVIRTELYRQFVSGPRDGNVGDIWLSARLANAGVRGRFLAHDLLAYRVWDQTVTSQGRGMDVHLMQEAFLEVRLPHSARREWRRVCRTSADVATRRYLRAGEVTRAAESLTLWPVRRWFQPRGVATVVLVVARALGARRRATSAQTPQPGDD